jgi:hypothetical protein
MIATGLGPVERAGVYGQKGHAWTVTNGGFIVGDENLAFNYDGVGIGLGSGGTVTNLSGGYLDGYGTGVKMYSGGGSVTNSGTIKGGPLGQNFASGAFPEPHDFAFTGVYIEGATGTVTNSRYIVGLGWNTSDGVDLTAGGSVSNSGTIRGAADFSGGFTFGVDIAGATGTVVNSGVLLGFGAVYLRAGGSVTNISGGLVDGDEVGVQIGGASGNVVNSSIIAATGTLHLNTGILPAPVSVGVLLMAGGSVTNSGTVEGLGSNGTVDGVWISGAAGQITNSAGGTITGAVGVYINPGDTFSNTIVNAGTITGTSGTAVSFADGQDLLVVEPGSTLKGAVAGLHTGDAIDFAGAAGTGVTFANGVLTLVDGNAAVTSLDLSGSFEVGQFAVSSDGDGGTDVSVLPALPGGTTADMILRDAGNGDYEIYNIGNNEILGAQALGQVGTEWEFAGVGDFNGTDTTDMILRDDNTGAFEVYDIRDNTLTAAAPLGQVGLEWQVAGFGNFNGTGAGTDMVLRDTLTGTFEIYDIANNAIIAASAIGQVGLEWQVGGFGDFSSNTNETDMVLRDVNTGVFEVYDINDSQLASASTLGQVGVEWQVAWFGDFSGNPNETDMMLRNVNTGVFELYDIQNNQIISASAIGQVGLEWQVAGFAPIAAPGESDMVLRDTQTGAFEVYDIAHNQLTGAASLGQVGSEWQVGSFAPDPLTILSQQRIQ